MTPSTLKYYIALQPKIREAMGPWKVRDFGYVEGLGIGILHSNGIMYFDSGTAINPEYCKDIIRIPLTCDDSSEEARKRSLWGMIDWSKTAIHNRQLTEEVVVCYYGNEGQAPVVSIGNLTDALLLALCAQWGVEVE